MGVYGGPDVVESNLILSLDAANFKSYSGIGTTVSNLVSINNGTLINGPTYDSSNGGSFSFDGTNDYINFGSGITSLDLTDKTFQAWIKKIGSSQKGIIDKEFDTGGENYGGWGFWTQSNNKLWWWSQGSKDLFDDGPLTINLGSWTNVAVSYNNTTKTAKFYINGILNSTKSDLTIVDKASGSANLVVGALRNGFSTFYFDGNISIVSAYNSILTDNEIRKNYIATKSRYSL